MSRHLGRCSLLSLVRQRTAAAAAAGHAASQLWPCQQQHHHQHHHQHQHRWLHLTTNAHGGKQRLADIMRLELLADKSADEVEAIWLSHHEAPDSAAVGTVMSSEEHTVFSARAAASPLCVLPLAKGARAFQTLLLQASPPRALAVTTLDAYRQQGPSAPPHFVVRLFDELAASHGLVLLRGELVSRPIINAAEGRTLLELARALYIDNNSYRRFVWPFNHAPDEFSFDELCRELRVGGGGGSAAAAGAAAGSS